MRSLGQLSIDAMFAVIFAMLLANQLITISDQMKSVPKETSIRAQEEQIGNNIAGLISSSMALSDQKFQIDYAIPGILDSEAFSPQKCTIQISPASNPDSIMVYYPDETSPTVTATVPFTMPSVNGILINGVSVLTPPATAKCTETITIKKTT